MTRSAALFALLCSCFRVAAAQHSAANPSVNSLLDVQRVYVGELVGTEAESIRELIIASLDSTRLFVLTDNPDRADAVLKGAADDHAYTDSLDVGQSVGARQNGGRYGSGSSVFSRSSGGYAGLAINDSETHHIKERKHEAYAAVRLCNKEGDVLWSTTQESQGAKFRGASADVANKIARQLTLDWDKAKRGSTPPPGN